MARSGEPGMQDYLGKSAGDSNSKVAKDDQSTNELMGSEYNMPITLMDKRHLERIIGTTKTSGTWRMKERVSY